MYLLTDFQQSFSDFIQNKEGIPFLGMVLLSFGGGLAASLTPCVLPMIPLYLSYIGVTNVNSKTDALVKSFLFCIGTALVFSLMGIFASFASFIMVDYRGYIHTTIGIFIFLMALSVIEIIKIPFPNIIKNIPHGGPFIVGIAFALISSPCASPILFAILALSSTVESSIKSALIMTAYSLGYTILIFFVGLFGGLTKRFDYFKKHNRIIINISGIILCLLGLLYLYSGISWFLN